MPKGSYFRTKKTKNNIGRSSKQRWKDSKYRTNIVLKLKKRWKTLSQKDKEKISQKIKKSLTGRNISEKHKKNIGKGNKKFNEKINFRRQIEIFDPHIFNKDVSIIGLGSIGSNTAHCLARLGIKNITVWDHDIVSQHNLPNQFYFEQDIGKSKTFCLSEFLKNNLNSNVMYNKIKPRTKFDKNSFIIDPIVIIAVDSMIERKKICDILKKSKFRPELIIDGRVGGPQLEIYTCQSLEEWEKTFVDNPSKDPCGARSICYISMIIGSLIANQVKRFIKSEPIKKTILFNIDSLQLI